MKIYRSDQLAILYRSFRFAQRNTLAVGMLGFFRFEQSDMAHLGSEPELWQAVADALGSAVLDEGYPKPTAEFKVYGRAYAPGGSPVQEMQVSACIGTLSKQLWVSGDRHFNAAGLISTAKPFVSMPLTPEHAFGGEGAAANPLGKGACAVKLADGREKWPLPNVEAPRQRMANRGDIVEPAGFWGFPAGTPLRDRHLGKFDDSWIKRTWPHLPDDTQLEFFHTAPADQRSTGYFVGNEAIELRGMHPRRSTLQTRLPGLRARCFIHRRESEGKETFGEIDARLDTVWLFPELECGIVLYRAQTATLDDDASDVLHVMAEWESLTDTALSFDHYQQLFRRRLQEDAGLAIPADGTALAAAPAAESAAPPAIPAALPVAAALATAPQMTPEIAEAHRLADQLERETAELLRKNGLSEKDVARFLVPQEEPVVSLAEAERMVDRLEQETRDLMKRNNLTDADVQKYLTQQKEPESSLKDVKEMMQSLEKQTSELLQKNGMTEQDVEKFLATRPDLAESLQNLKDAKAANVPLSAIPDSFPEMPKVDPQLLQPQDAGLLVLGAATPAASSMAQLTREQVIERHAAKEPLAGFDLSGLDLSGLDLSAADFSGSLLEKTAFTGSRLGNANLAGCLLQQADCSGADLSGAILSEVSAANSVFTGACLKSAQIRDADFTGADFGNAQLQQAVLDGTAFDQASMAAVQAAGCIAHQSNFSGADLSGANFEQAVLTQATFYGSKLNAVSFKAAHCQQAEFYGADASGARFTIANLDESRADGEARFVQTVFDGAQLRRAAWDGTQLSGATFTEAVLDDADFSNVRAPDSRFRNASARHARFGGADLAGSDLTGINLFKGSLRKSQIEKAVLHFANLYGVDFEGTTVRASAVQEADIGQTILAFRPPLA
ncbi:MAG: DUF2169 domain-containing protein [Burkholderiaceae bacterium]